jgi:hypothetical protein
MRRRSKVRTIREEESPTLLLMAAGAVAGAAAGLYLGRRYRSMDAFLEDVRDRFGSLRDLWNAAEELPLGRRSRLQIDVDDDEEELDEEEDALEEVDEEELDDEAFATSDAYDEDSYEEEDADDDDDELEEDDFDDDLAAVARDNGVASESLRRSEDIARRLEERVLDALHEEPVLSSRSIEIAVVGDGVVELTGSVHAIEEISRASALVRAIPGVSMVLNRIEVRAGGSIDTASVSRDSTSE